MSAHVIVVDASPATAIGRALMGLPETRSVDIAGLPGSLAAGDASAGIVIGAGGDPAAAARVAAAAGVPVLIEPVGILDPAVVTELLAVADSSGGTLYAGFRRRFEPDVRWSRGTVASGGIGLPWGVHAEVLRSLAPDPLTEALDLLDTLALVSGCVPLAMTRFDRGRGAPLVLSVTLDHGTTGHVVVRAAEGRGGQGPELATFRVMGSHGTVAGDLDLPGQTVTSAGRVTHERVGTDGAARLVSAFLGVIAGSSGPRPAELRGAIRDLELLASGRRRGRGTR